MLYLELQQGKDGMESAINNTLGATARCTVRLLEGLNVHLNADVGVYEIKGDAWFGPMKAALVIGVSGHQVMLHVKDVSGLYPKKFIGNTLQYASVGVSSVLKGTTPNEAQFVTIIGYR